VTVQKASKDLQKNLLYLAPAMYYSHSESVYIFLPHGVIRVSEHDTGKSVKWKLFPNKWKCKGRRCYGAGEIGAMICDIKRELAASEFAGRVR